MNVPNFENIQFIEKSGYLTESWQNLLQQLFTQLQLSVGPEGFVISDVSSASNSVTPPTAGGQVAVLEATFGQQNGVKVGTVIFDPAEVNGGSSGSPNGQLKVLLQDGTFHKITNT